MMAVLREKGPSTRPARFREAARDGPVIRLLPIVVTVQAAALAGLLGLDGSLPWRTIRVALVVAAAAAGIAVLRGPRNLGRGLAALAMGTIGVITGIGLGSWHVMKSDAGATSFLGLVCLGAGLVLMCWGTAKVWEASRGWRRLPAVLACAAVALTLVYATVPAVMATNVPPTSLSAGTPADHGLRYADVHFPARDGVELSGWYIASRNRAAIALLHGASSTRSAVLAHAAVLARHGYGVLLFDARGHGRSDGRAMDFGWYGDLDLWGAVSFLESKPDVDPHRIAAAGLSMGAEEAIGAAATDRRIRAVVAEGATGRVAADKAWLSQAYGVRGWVQEQLDRVTYATADLLTAAAPPLELTEAVSQLAPRRVLLIAAGRVADEGKAAQRLRRASPSTVEVWVAPGADHVGARSTDPHAWEAQVTAFLDKSLRQR
jgi:pimeloyl-ACP methyl ester carboxylesterase